MIEPFPTVYGEAVIHPRPRGPKRLKTRWPTWAQEKKARVRRYRRFVGYPSNIKAVPLAWTNIFGPDPSKLPQPDDPVRYGLEPPRPPGPTYTCVLLEDGTVWKYVGFGALTVAGNWKNGDWVNGWERQRDLDPDRWLAERMDYRVNQKDALALTRAIEDNTKAVNGLVAKVADLLNGLDQLADEFAELNATLLGDRGVCDETERDERNDED